MYRIINISIKYLFYYPYYFLQRRRRFEMTNATVTQNLDKHQEEGNKIVNGTETIEAPNKDFNISETLNTNNSPKSFTLNNTDTSLQKINGSNTKLNENNTVPKNSINKDGKNDEPTKRTGHAKNSLTRRKRSLLESEVNPVPDRIASPPVIVNYETSHGPDQPRTWLSPIKAGNIIEASDLADFKIITQHNNPNNNDKGIRTEKSSEENSGDAEHLNENSNESTESVQRSTNYQKPTHNSDENNNNDHYNHDASESKEINENSSNESRSNKNEKQLSLDHNNSNSGENNSNENDDLSSFDKAKYSTPQQNSKDRSYDDKKEKPAYSSTESNDSTENKSEETSSNETSEREHNRKIQDIGRFKPKDTPYKPQHLETPSKSSSESSEENRSQNSEEKIKLLSNSENYKNSPQLTNKSPELRNVDLGDFSYETVQVNEKEKNIPPKEAQEYPESDSEEKIIISTTFKPHSNMKHFPNELNEENDKLIKKINDGEVKPVVELSTEEDTSESSEESTKAEIKDEGETESLETVLGVKIENEDNQNDKIVTESIENGDIKQQFERIPLNYNHNDKTNDNDTGNQQNIEPPQEKNNEPTNNDGTIDALSPENDPLDENLNIKFDNLAFKLPEIKLPDDILAFTKKYSPFYDENGKSTEGKPYQYYRHREDSNNKNKANDENEENVDDNDDTYYSRYYGNKHKKQNYKEKEADEEDDKEEDDVNEDLYEKFVRERFGKRDTFEKRSEKIQAAPGNPQLYQQLQNILKKTADIDEQAKKSNDPNANYMWTLEYGEKLK